MKVIKSITVPFARMRTSREKLSGSFRRLAMGGEWAVNQPAETRRNLIWFWFDGFFASGSDNIVITYLVVYLLASGATQGQIGLMSSISSLVAAVVLLPGAWLVERLGRRRGIVLVGGGWARVSLLLLALLPFLLGSNVLVLAGIAISISRDAMTYLSYPAWMAITGDIIPIEGRGRYFASRNFIMSVTGIVATFLVGMLITRIPGTGGYQIALGLAFIIGSFAIFSFSHIIDRPQRAPVPQPVMATTEDDNPTGAESNPPQVKRSFWNEINELFSYQEFIQFLSVTALWNIALNFAGPFFTVYLVKNLGADAVMVSLTSIASSISSMLLMFKLGQLNDRWGARKLTIISGLLIPIVPLAWAFVDSVWYIIPINLVSGALWGAYGMGSFNYLLTIIPVERRARFSAIFQIVVTVSLAIGAALGSLAISSPWGFAGVFIGSAAGRLVAALLFVRLSVHKKIPPRPVEQVN